VRAIRRWDLVALAVNGAIGAGIFGRDLPSVGLSGVMTHANSLYLQALVEGGIPMIPATLYFVWVSIARFVRRASASPFASAGLAASIFHFGEFTVRAAKSHMAAADLPMRLDP